jgi:hypothetical protein
MIIKIVFYKSSSKFYDSVCINCGIFENFVQNKSSNVLTITFEDLKEHFFEYGGVVEHLGRCELNTFVAQN